MRLRAAAGSGSGARRDDTARVHDVRGDRDREARAADRRRRARQRARRRTQREDQRRADPECDADSCAHQSPQSLNPSREQGRPTLPSTMGQERDTNPFLRIQQADVAKAAAVWAGRSINTPVEVFAVLREWKNNFK